MQTKFVAQPESLSSSFTAFCKKVNKYLKMIKNLPQNSHIFKSILKQNFFLTTFQVIQPKLIKTFDFLDKKTRKSYANNIIKHLKVSFFNFYISIALQNFYKEIINKYFKILFLS